MSGSTASEGASQSNSDTIGSLLARENPEAIALDVKSDGLTTPKNSCVFTNVVDWEGFTYEEFEKHKVIRDILKETDFRTPGSVFQVEFPRPQFSQLDRLFRHEDGFEHQILSRDIIPSVNHALKLFALRMYKTEQEALHIGRAGRSDSENDKSDTRKRPDWVSPAEDRDRPGITEENWKKPIKQILGYSDELECRHSFIITEKELVVYEFEKETGPAPSTSGPERPSSGSSHTPSDNPIHSGDKSTEEAKPDRRYPDRDRKPVVAFKSRDQGDEEQEEKVYYSVKYKVIPWADHGEGKLTVRLGLFIICVLVCCPEEFSGPQEKKTQEEKTQEEKTQKKKTQKKKKTATAANKKAPSGRGEGETSHLASGDET
ncbi:hypothetical protein PG987_001211 [Apiospora arundinis]